MLKRELQKARTERDILKKAARIFGAATRGRSGSRMSIVISGPFAFADGLEPMATIGSLCTVLGVSVSGYHAWHRRPESKRSIENRALLRDIRCAHAESGGCYGAPRVHATLRAAGRCVGRHRIARLMRLAGLRGLAAIPRRVRTTDSRHDYPPLGKTVPVRRGNALLASFLARLTVF